MKRFWITFRDIILILLLTIFSMMVGGFWLNSWEVNKFVLPLHYFCSPIIELIVFLFGFKLLKKKIYHDEYSSVKFPPSFHKRYFIYAFCLLLLCYVGVFILGGKFVFPKLDSYLLAQNTASLLGAIIIAPFIEETVFRAVILTQTAKRYNLKVGIIVSSILFGAVHLMNGGLDFISAIQLIIGGALMGTLLNVVYIKENTIWASYIIHALYNAIGSFIPVSLKATPDWFVEFILKNNNKIITGGEYGIDCSLINIIAYLIIIIAIVAIVHKNGSTLHDIWSKNHSN